MINNFFFAHVQQTPGLTPNRELCLLPQTSSRPACLPSHPSTSTFKSSLLNPLLSSSLTLSPTPPPNLKSWCESFLSSPSPLLIFFLYSLFVFLFSLLNRGLDRGDHLVSLFSAPTLSCLFNPFVSPLDTGILSLPHLSETTDLCTRFSTEISFS